MVAFVEDAQISYEKKDLARELRSQIDVRVVPLIIFVAKKKVLVIVTSVKNTHVRDLRTFQKGGSNMDKTSLRIRNC
ncbi:hypothetical protein [Desulfosporosinus nitroreducens]|uniref:hypothetical protein n=1 Tax=Desulfosporosinus nitroreducens TaxID=2018668 RepID=UPI00207D4C83|nr:hypothetical protein [Desulfosporosinus nitroreducens]MCO1604653.1 hypothetical protein [Desulfosporosinus nitroreducens]